MKSYILTIPLAAFMVGAFWWSLIGSLNDNTFDSPFAWIMGGFAGHAALIGILYHFYRTYTDSWKK